MRSKTYGDKQREKQQRKRQDELKKKINPEPLPAAESPKVDADKAGQALKKESKKGMPSRRTA